MIDYFFSGAYTQLLSHVQFFVTTWTAAYQAPPSMGFSRQEYWSGVQLPSLKQMYRDCLFKNEAQESIHEV